MGSFWINIGLWAVGVLGSGDVSTFDHQYRLELENIYVSKGQLEPSFDPSIEEYNLKLVHAVNELAVTPKINQTFEEYKGGEGNLPIVTIDWTDYLTGRSETSSLAVRRQIDLPDEGESIRVRITVQNPNLSAQKKVYKINVSQSGEKMTLLKGIDGIDNNDYGIIVAPPVNEDNSVYSVYVRPEARWVKLGMICSSGSSVSINGKTHRKEAKVYRERDHHKQSLEVVCSKGNSLIGNDVRRTYVINLISDYKIDDIMIPRIVLNNAGSDCTFDESRARFVCRDPKDRDQKARVTGYIDPAIRYTIESSDKSVQVRVLDGISTIPFSYRNDLQVVATAGRFSQAWPLKFEGGVVPGFMRTIGYILAGILAVLLFVFLIIIGAAQVSGIGVPFGSTEIIALAFFLLQYLCFCCYMRGSNMLTDLVDPLRWVTLFWPLPWSMDDPAGTHHRRLFEAAPSHGIALWGDSLIGDVTDVRNGFGAMLYSALIITSVMIIHLIMMAILRSKNHTFPHRMRLGNWESRFMHWCVFPASTGSAFVLFHDSTSALAKGLSAMVYVVYLGWLSSVFGVIYHHVRSRKVTWVWHTSTREDGGLESDAGYWCDVVCNQLTTTPVNRSILAKVFSWKWISTVGDIDPINIYPNMNKKKNNDDFGPTAYKNTHKESGIPIGKNPMSVDIIRGRQPSSIAPGQRLTAGMMSTNWLDMLFTYQSVNALHSQVVSDSGRAFSIPLTVKLHQLTGPCAFGANAYFFDGARVPFIRIGDALTRMVLGLLVGMALASSRHSVDAIAFACISAVGAAATAYLVYTRPYSRHLENWMSVSIFASISVSAFSFFVYAVQKKEPAILTDIFLWIVALLCICIAAYCSIVIVSVFSAIMCPPLDETRFLESIANCNVTISNHCGSNSWACDIPAYTKYNCRALKARCMSKGGSVTVQMYPTGEEPTLEFNISELAKACKTGSLSPPAVVLVAPCEDPQSIGYRHLNIYDTKSILGDVAHFLSEDGTTRKCASEVAQQISKHLKAKSKGHTILIITVVPH